LIQPSFVTAGLDPAVHTARRPIRRGRMDARVKPAHDDFFAMVDNSRN
jgi:hypothetical protein